jgi:hypothetical protein
MQVFKTKWFARFARQEGIADANLTETIKRAEHGLIDADLGGGLIKARRPPRQGRIRGYRAVIAYRLGIARCSSTHLPRAIRPTSRRAI